MTGQILRARRLRLPSRRLAEASRSQSELAEDLGYNTNAIALFERGKHPLGKRGKTLHLALCTIERAAGLVEWQNLHQQERTRWLAQADADAENYTRRRAHSPATKKATKKAASKVRRK